MDRNSTNKFADVSNFSIMNHDTLAFGKSDGIGFVNLESGEQSFNYIIDKEVMSASVCGVSCIAANKNEPIYAIGDISTPPRILLYSCQNTCIGQLKSIQYFSALAPIFLFKKHYFE